MNSSTSSSEQPASRRILLRIVLFLLAVFVVLEVLTRQVLMPRSLDFARFPYYPDRAKVLCEQTGLRLAFVGNSATQRGIDGKQLVAEWPRMKEQPLHADFFLADGSMINTWQYLVKKSFWRPEQNPDWIVIHFFTTCLQDGNRFEIGRLAYFFTEPDDWQELFDLDLPTFSDRSEYLLSTTWATYAVRDRIKKRVMGAVIPNYMGFLEELNRVQLGQEKKAGAEPAVTHRALARFLAYAKKHGTNVCFVAFPTGSVKGKMPYELHPDAVQQIQDAGMRLLDLRLVPELQPEHYEDNIHLTPEGAAIYTRHFSKAFRSMLE